MEQRFDKQGRGARGLLKSAPWFYCALLVACLATVPVSRAESEIPRLTEGAPDTYSVQRGDTLWDISALFLNEPWRWPELWRVNPTVRDPNLIYPGDILYLRWDNGAPGIYLSKRSAASGVTRLSPTMRSEPLKAAIPEIPRDLIEPFIKNHRFLRDFNSQDQPRILAGYGGRLISGVGDSVYVTGNAASAGENYDVLRPAQELISPVTGESLGQLMEFVGRVALSQAAANQEQASRFDVVVAREELRAGDLLFPVVDGKVVSTFRLRAPDTTLKSAELLSVDSGVSQIGALDVVAVNLGDEDGGEVGHVFAIEKHGDRISDPVSGKWLSPPPVRAGTLMLFAVHERASFGLILGANQPLSVGDKLAMP
jgi:hypothetical protein